MVSPPIKALKSNAIDVICSAYFREVVFVPVGPVQLGIGFLQQGSPELVFLDGPEVDQLAVAGGQEVVNHHFHPRAESPKPEPEDSSVAATFFERLL